MQQQETASAAADVSLTPKGERYASDHQDPLIVGALRLPKRKLLKLRRIAEQEIERLVGLLDRIDGDADLEPSLGAPEAMPSLHYVHGRLTTRRGSQLRWAHGNRTELEGDATEDDEEAGDEEPSLGSLNVRPGRTMVDGNPIWPNQTQMTDAEMDQSHWATGHNTDDLEDEFDGREDGADDEPALGAPETGPHVSLRAGQVRWADGSRETGGDDADGEPSDNGIGDSDGLRWVEQTERYGRAPKRAGQTRSATSAGGGN